MKTKKVKLKDLEINQKLTNIRHINVAIVSRYREAYRSDANMPMPIIAPGNLIVSGNHRVMAMLKEYGEDREIMVEEREYANDLEILQDFVRENATHGYLLDGVTRKKLIRELLNEGATLKQISSVFNITEGKLEKIASDVITVVLESGEVEDRPAKRGFETDKPITAKQYEEHDKHDRGLTIVQQAGQIIRWLKNGYVRNTQANVEILKKLAVELDKFLIKVTEKNKSEVA